MKPALPLCCKPEAFNLLSRQLPALGSPDALLESAIAISMHEMDGVRPEGVDRALQGYANTIRKRVRGHQPQAILAHLHELLFEEVGFTGNLTDYYQSSNSYLPAVLKSKRGLPITLSLIYKVVGERVGLRVHGIGLPGHFVVAVESGDSTGNAMIIDPFRGGQTVSPDEAHERLRDNFGPEMEWSDELLQPVSNLHWLTRMLQNLLHVFGAAGQYYNVAAMLEMEMLLWPDQTHLQRDLALVLARLDQAEAATVWLEHYLRSNPDDPQKQDLTRLLEVLSA
jgi:regulator of sirC expression with transglutaminase-like and TPR domain